jgi:hypothetical protein
MNAPSLSTIGPDARLSLCNVARSLGVSPKSVARWARVGVCGVGLPTIKVGGRVYVLKADLDVFLAETNRAPSDRKTSAPVVPLKGRRIAEAEAACDRAGI